LVDSQKKTNWSPSLRSVYSLSRVSDFRIPRQEAPLPIEN